MMTAVGDFLRTALLVDDRIESADGPLEAIAELAGEVGADDTPTGGLKVPVEPDETPVHSLALSGAFLRAGVACTIISPKEVQDDLVEVVVSASRIIDVLILDWLLFGDADRTVELVESVARTSGGEVRAIVIYTGEPNLLSVQERLHEDCGFEIVRDYVLRRDNCVALIFAKPGVQLLGADADRAAGYEDLPDRIRDDVATVFGGIVSEVAFSGVNAVRQSVPKLLGTFVRELDPALLLHRLLLVEPDDAGEHLLEAVIDGMRTFMLDARSDSVLTRPQLRRFVESNPQLLGDPEELASDLRKDVQLTQSATELTNEMLVREMVLGGLSSLGIDVTSRASLKPNRLKLIEKLFLHGAEADDRFAAVMCSRPFGDAPPMLGFGTVVRAGGSYLLCLQASCDSVRIVGERKFPMMTLDRPPKAGSRSDIVLRDGGEQVHLQFSSKPYALEHPVFVAGESGSVLAAPSDDGWVFTSKTGDEFIGVCVLRSEFAQQALGGLLAATGRPGVNASEFVRRRGSVEPSPPANAESG